MAQLTLSLLDSFEGKNIEEICPLGFGKKGDAHNHCAHFTSHVLRLNNSAISGTTCADMVYNGKKNFAAGGIIRVNDIFNTCVDIDEPLAGGCLAYYTLQSNMQKDGYMGSAPDKHVGICYEGFVYNYGNKHDKVRKNKIGDLAKIYGKDTITLYTALPAGATALSLEEIKALVNAP